MTVAYYEPAPTKVVGDAGETTDLNQNYGAVGQIIQAVATIIGQPNLTPAASMDALRAYLVDPAVAGSVVTGLQHFTGGGAVTATDLNAAVSDGYTGVYLSPRDSWDLSGLDVFGISNFIIASDQAGSVGWTGAQTLTTSRCTTGAGADGIAVWGYTGSETTGVVFRGLAITGSNTHGVVHFGGRQRNCGMDQCYIENTNASAGAYALIVDSGLTGSGSYPSTQNSEDAWFDHLRCVGAYAAIGLGIYDTGQHANDTWWHDVTTSSTGPYSIVCAPGANHNFSNWYDRSSPSVAQVYCSGGTLYFRGGEDLANSTTGCVYALDDASSVVVVDNRTISLGGRADTVIATVSAGNLVARGRCRWSGVIALTATGNVDLSDAAGNFGALTIDGTGGAGSQKVLTNGWYSPGGPVTFTAYTGTVNVQGSQVVAQRSGIGQTTAQTATWTPPNGVACMFEIDIAVRATTAGTSTIPVVAYTTLGSTALSFTPQLWAMDSAATAPVFSIVTGSKDYQAHVAGRTDTGGHPVTVTVTPTGSTFRYSVVIKWLGTA